MTVLNSSGRDIDEVPFVNMLKHWLSQHSIVDMVKQRKLVTITPIDHRGLAGNTMPKHRAAFIIRRMLFDKGVLRLCAKVVAQRYKIDYNEAKSQLETIRTELKDLAHVSSAGLVLASDQGQPSIPRDEQTDLEKRIEQSEIRVGERLINRVNQNRALGGFSNPGLGHINQRLADAKKEAERASGNMIIVSSDSTVKP